MLGKLKCSDVSMQDRIKAKIFISHSQIKNKILNLVTIGVMSRMFADGPGDLCSISGRVIPKTQKWYLMPVCLTLSLNKVRIKGKAEQSREWSSTFPLHLDVVAIKQRAFGSPSTKVANFTFFIVKKKNWDYWIFLFYWNIGV